MPRVDATFLGDGRGDKSFLHLNLVEGEDRRSLRRLLLVNDDGLERGRLGLLTVNAFGLLCFQPATLTAGLPTVEADRELTFPIGRSHVPLGERSECAVADFIAGANTAFTALIVSFFLGARRAELERACVLPLVTRSTATLALVVALVVLRYIFILVVDCSGINGVLLLDRWRLVRNVGVLLFSGGTCDVVVAEHAQVVIPVIERAVLLVVLCLLAGQHVLPQRAVVLRQDFLYLVPSLRVVNQSILGVQKRVILSTFAEDGRSEIKALTGGNEGLAYFIAASVSRGEQHVLLGLALLELEHLLGRRLLAVVRRPTPIVQRARVK